MYTRTFVLFLIFILYTFIVIFAIMCEKGRKRPEVFRGALPVHVILCYLVLKKAFCDFCLSGFVMVSYKAIILTFSLRMIFLRVADIERYRKTVTGSFPVCMASKVTKEHPPGIPLCPEKTGKSKEKILLWINSF